MRKLHYFFSLLLLAMVGLGAQAASWVQGDALTSIVTGKQLLVSYAGQTRFLCGDKESTVVTNDCIYMLEETGEMVDGLPTYRLKQVSTGKYLQDQELYGGADSWDNPPHGEYGTHPYVAYTADASLAYVFTLMAPVADSDNGRESVATGKGPGGPVENAWVLCCKNKKDGLYYYLGSVGDPFISPYTDTNQWVFYDVEEAAGKDILIQELSVLFPNGFDSSVYPVGTNPGEFSQEAYNKVAELYYQCEELLGQPGNPTVAECEALAAELKVAKEALLASAVPVTPGYYWILGGLNSGKGVYGNTEGIYWNGDFSVVKEPDLAKAPYIWEVKEAADGKFYICNYSTGLYAGTHKSNSQLIPAIAEASETYTFQYSTACPTGGFFDIINTTRGTSVSWNTDPAGKVVFWSTGAGENAYFKVVPVAASVIDGMAELVEQGRLNTQLEALYGTAKASYMKGRVFEPSDVEKELVECGDYDVPGLILDAAQMSSNAPDAEAPSMEALVDYDFNTYFHSAWRGDTPDEPHHLQVDLDGEYDCLIFKMSQRVGQLNNANPTKFTLYATNDLAGEWVNEGSYMVDWKYTATVNQSDVLNFTGVAAVEMSKPYRYVRFAVTETTNNQKYNGYPFFYLSKFDAYAAKYDAEASAYEQVDATVRAEFEKQLDAAAKELEAGKATEATIAALQAAYDAFIVLFPDYTRVEAALEEMNVWVAQAPVGEEVGYFPLEAKEEFDNAVATVAELVNSNMTLEKINNSLATLDEAFAKLQSSLILPAENTTFVLRTMTQLESAANNVKSMFYAASNAEGANVKWGGHTVADGADEDTVDPETTPNYLWFIESVDGTAVTIRNFGTGLYLAAQDKVNNAVTLSANPTKLQLRSALVGGGFNIEVGNGLYANLGGYNNMVASDQAQGADNSAIAFEDAYFSTDGSSYRPVYRGYQTFCFPYDLVNTFDGVTGEAFNVIGEKDGKLYLSYITDDIIEAGVPFIYCVPEYNEDLFESQTGTVDELFQLASGDAIPTYNLNGLEVNGLVGTVTGTKTAQNNIGVFQLVTGMTYKYELVVKTTISAENMWTVGPNSAYLNGQHEKDVVVEGEEGKDYVTIDLKGDITAIQNAPVAARSNVDVYTVSGVRVRANVKSSDAKAGLPAGLYIIGGQKVLVK